MWALSRLIWRNFFQRVFEPFMAFVFPVIIYLIIRFVIPFGDATDYTKANYIIPGIMLYIPMTLGMMVLPVQIMQFKESVIIKRIGVTPINKKKLTMIFALNYVLLGILGAISFIAIASLVELAVGNLASSPQHIVKEDANIDLTNLTQSKLVNILDVKNEFNKDQILALFNEGNLEGLTSYLKTAKPEINWDQEEVATFVQAVTTYSGNQSIPLNSFLVNLSVSSNDIFTPLGDRAIVTEAMQKAFSPQGGLFDIAKQQAILDTNQNRGELDIFGYLLANEGIGYFILFFLLGNIMSILCGLMLSAISKSLPMAQALGSLVFFPSMFLTGMYFPIPFQGGAGWAAWAAPWRSVTILMFMSWFGTGSLFSTLSGNSVEGITSDFFGLKPSELPLGESDSTWIAIGITIGFLLLCLIITLWKFKWSRLRS